MYFSFGICGGFSITHDKSSPQKAIFLGCFGCFTPTHFQRWLCPSRIIPRKSGCFGSSFLLRSYCKILFWRFVVIFGGQISTWCTLSSIGFPREALHIRVTTVKRAAVVWVLLETLNPRIWRAIHSCNGLASSTLQSKGLDKDVKIPGERKYTPLFSVW